MVVWKENPLFTVVAIKEVRGELDPVVAPIAVNIDHHLLAGRKERLG